jgi:hypothetical protein
MAAFDRTDAAYSFFALQKQGQTAQTPKSNCPKSHAIPQSNSHYFQGVIHEFP